MKSPVTSKRDFTKRFQTGEFGNRTETWNTLDEVMRSGHPGSTLIHIRNRVANGPTFYNVRLDNLLQVFHDLALPIQPAKLWYFAAMALSEKTLIQGEVMRGVGGYELTYNTCPLPMREGMLEGLKTAKGLHAGLMLQHYLDPCDFDWLMELLDNYPDHVIEFSHYQVPCGTLNRRMIVWEVRKGY